MSRHDFPTAVVCCLAVLIPCGAWAQTHEGTAIASTSSSRHSNCDNPSGALQWSFHVQCIDACGDVYDSHQAQGSADGYCFIRTFGSNTFCNPPWQYLNHTQGQYAITSAWPQKWVQFLGCANQDNPAETEVHCGMATECEEEEDPPPPPPDDPDDPPGPIPCSVTPPVETDYLALTGQAQTGFEAMAESIFTGRIEEVGEFSYIMEDWELVGLDGSGAAPVVASGVEDELADHPVSVGSASMTAQASGPPQEPTSLGVLIASPVHPRNSRHIPAPGIGLRNTRLPYQGEGFRVAVRIDLGEDRVARDAQVLHALGQVPSELDLGREIASRLRVRYASARQHRVIVFAVADVDRHGMVHMRDSQVVLPLCCCNPICV